MNKLRLHLNNLQNSIETNFQCNPAFLGKWGCERLKIQEL